MKSLSISIDSDCYFFDVLATAAYDLGHLVLLDKQKFDGQKFVHGTQEENLLKLDAWPPDCRVTKVDRLLNASKPDSETQNIAISIVELSDKQSFTIDFLVSDAFGAYSVENVILSSAGLINGADIYEKMKSVVHEQFVSVISKIAKGQDLGRDKVKETFDLFNQADISKIRGWHRSNDTDRDYPNTEQSLFQIFQSSAQAHPNKTAIVHCGVEISYRELLDKAKTYSEIIEKAIPKHSTNEVPVVALFLGKSIELYIAILAVLRMGAAYVPIDPEYPSDRVANILQNSKPEILLKDRDISLREDYSGTLLDLRTLVENSEQNGLLSKQHTIQHQSHPDDTAVIIYTSGSTGTPKGVKLSHRNIVHFCWWYQTHVELDYRSTCLQFTTVSFDASLLDIFPTLLQGAKLVVPNDEQRHQFDLLDKLVRSENVTHCFIPPAMLSALPEYEWPAMEHITTGGDLCDTKSIHHWSRQASLHNIYGPTECTVLATTDQFKAESDNRIIGKPISNTKIYILDEALNPVTTGEYGELYISGSGVGPGYYGSIEMTRERYVHDPFSISKEKMMYKTGDTCYWDHEGKIHFVGRKDNQLKIRGFRVELGEIENAILDTGLYSSCVVVANDKKRIISFLSGANQNSSVTLLKEIIEAALPSYMIPEKFVEVEQFPFTSNGKIDRKKLLKSIRIENICRVDEELNEIELKLRKIWAESLDVDPLDIPKKESFFNLGGHSLLVSKMLLSVKTSFNGNFTLARFMESPTIESLALLLTDTSLQKGDQISDRIYSDMVLDASIVPLSNENVSAFDPKNVLVTGATGFLGVHIVQELIKRTNADIHCVIRETSEERAYNKLYNAYKKYDVRLPAESHRIKPILGDLSKPLLGLSETVFSDLSERIDIIYHNGALVNHIYDYDYLYNTNVRSTVDLLTLSTTGKNKQFVYVSTLSAASNVNSCGRIIEDGPAQNLPIFVNNGYNLTKWVSEQLVWQAYNRGLPSTIMRPGNISGHSKTGFCYPDQNRILLLLKGSVQMGVVPNWDANFDLCPVDFVAQGIVEGSLGKNKHVPVLHFHNPTELKWTKYVSRLNYHDVPVRLIDPKDWRKKLLEIDEANALYNVVSFYLDEANEDISDISNIDHHITLRRLAQSGMRYPEKNDELVDANLGFLVKCGFITNPTRATKSVFEAEQFPPQQEII